MSTEYRATTIQQLEAAKVLEHHGRIFVASMRVCTVYWHNNVQLALNIQSWWRGFVDRCDYEREVFHMHRWRYIRRQHVSAKKIQARYRWKLTFRRFQVTRKAVVILQRYCARRMDRLRYLKVTRGIAFIQAALRGIAARARLSVLLGQTMLTEEQRQLDAYRGRETSDLAAIASQPLPVRRQAFRLLDVDPVTDCAMVYPRGWAASLSRLSESLSEKGAAVVDVRVGGSHTALLADTGELFLWGWGDQGQLGHGAPRNEPAPRLLDLGPPPADPHQQRLLLARKHADRKRNGADYHTGGFRGAIVSQVALGQDHAVALLADGGVLSWGCNRRGQLGQGTSPSTPTSTTSTARAETPLAQHPLGEGEWDASVCPTPRRVRHLPPRRAVQVACSAHHTVCLLEGGLVVNWGRGKQLGTGVFCGTGNCPLPQVVEALAQQPVQSVSCGWGHTLALTQRGEVFGWGENRCGQVHCPPTHPTTLSTRDY
jgi:hypothetical protein